MTTSVAIAILATKEYWKGAQVMFYCLRKYGMPEWVHCYALGASQCKGATCLPITYDYSWIKVSQRYFSEVAGKFFSLTMPYDRIILLDADMLCLGDCSLLWSNRIGSLPFYACRDTAGGVYYPEATKKLGLDHNLLFHAGTMVFQMDRLGVDFHSRLIQSIADGTTPSYDGGDQGYLNHWFLSREIEIGYLPREYNACTDAHHPKLPEHSRKIVHLTGPNVNPWAPRITQEDQRWRWIELWRNEFKESQG